MSSDMGTSHTRESLKNDGTIDRAAIAAVIVHDGQRTRVRYDARHDLFERRRARNAFDLPDIGGSRAERVARDEAANLALAVEHERVVGAAVQRGRHGGRIE